MKHSNFDFDQFERDKQAFFANGGQIESLPPQTIENYQQQKLQIFAVSAIPDDNEYSTDEPKHENQIDEEIQQTDY